MGIPLRARARSPLWSSAWDEVRSPPSAENVVDAVWSGRAGRDGLLRVFPDGCTDLTWDGTRLRAVSSASVTIVQLRRGQPSDGLRLRCGAAAAILGGTGVVAGVVDLRDLPGASCVAALERDLRVERLRSDRRRDLLLRWVNHRATSSVHAGPSRSPLSPSIVTTLASLPPPSVAALHGLSTRSLQREVRAATGMAPKTLSRVLRLRGFLRDALPMLGAGQRRLADVAAELGYADQSHLGRECRAMTAATPASLLRAWCRADRTAPP